MCPTRATRRSSAPAGRPLAGFKVPAAIVRLDALPRTPGGKLRREAVRALLDDGPAGILARPDGDAIGWRRTGDGGTPLVLLPGTLSTAGQLDRLAAELARPGDLVVHALDRRGSGTSVLADPRPLDVSTQVADLVAYLDARGLDAPIVVGISFGAVLGLETAARHPGRVRALVAWEPPYIPLADADTQARIGGQADALTAAYAEGGPPAVTDRFMRAVGGDARWEGLPAGARAWLGREGTSALADAGLLGLEPDGLGRITAPTTILVGTEGDPFAPAVAEALAARIRGARRGDDRRVRAPEPDHRRRPVCPIGSRGAGGCRRPRAGPERRSPTGRDHPGGPPMTDIDPMPSPPPANGAPVGRRDRRRQRRADARGPGDVRPHLAGLRPDEPGDLGVPGAVLASRASCGRPASDPGGSALDVASGTGKVAADLHRRVQPGGRVLGIDISPGMIDIARRQYAGRPGLEYAVGDALALPTEDGSFDVATIAFGMRNLPDYRRGFAEMARSVRPGGRVLCLEIARPRSRLARFMRWWFDRIVPLIGRVAGQGDAYSYLVRSVRNYPAPERIAEIMREAGLVDVHWRGLTGGIVTLHVGTVPRT